MNVPPRTAALVVATACASLAALAADAPREEHGAGDAYARPAAALAWGIVRDADEAKTAVVLRVIADPAVFPLMSATGRDPFSDRRATLLAPTATGPAIDIRVPRARFAEFPRTDVRFYSASAAPSSDAPDLVVYYLGVPDTTPEFADEAALSRSLDDRIERARARAAKR